MADTPPPELPALHFVATECGSRVEHGTMVCGASNSRATRGPRHTFILMRQHPDLDDDDGPYFELDEQANGFHDGVERVDIEGSCFTFHLRPPPGLGSGHAQVGVDLRDCRQADIRRFRRGLETVFRDQPWRLGACGENSEGKR